MGLDSFRPQLPILLSTLIILVSTVLPLLPKHWPLRIQVPIRVAALLVLTMLVDGIIGSPLEPHFSATRPSYQLWQQFIEAGWFFVAARTAVALGRFLVVLENRPRETRIASDLLAGAIYVATALAIINFAFQVPIRGVLATSGVIAIVLGLALQSTLSDVFSGIAVGLERPYKPGDMLWVEGNIEGRVVQLNWRSTQIATGQDNIAIIPNSVMAKARMINRSAPTSSRGDSISLELDPAAIPEDCMAALEAAVLGSSLLLSRPSPTVRLNGLKGDGALYEISFSVASTEGLAAARAELLSQIHRHLRHSGIALAVTGICTLPKRAVPSARDLMEESELFGGMNSLDRDLLAEHLKPDSVPTGYALLREGEKAEGLFVMAQGTAKISKSDHPDILYRVGPGDSFGIVGLVTGTSNAVTVTALTPLKFFKLDKTDISAALKNRPELSAGLESLVQRGQAVLCRFATVHEEKQLAKPEVFLARLKGFLHALGH
jgi:small-conductance mechanosensitive channel